MSSGQLTFVLVVAILVLGAVLVAFAEAWGKRKKRGQDPE